MVKKLLYLYRPAFANTVVYMLQASEYRPQEYLHWFWRTNDFSKVTYRKELVRTRPAKLLLYAYRLGYLVEIILSLFLLAHGLSSHSYFVAAIGLSLFLIMPVLLSHLMLALLLGGFVITKPKNIKKIRRSSHIFSNHPAERIAIAGSYGKTTMKEILKTVLNEGRKVKATPANKNVAISHAQFADSLDGDEDILIIEYGEGAPGDVMKFARRTHPTAVIITGVAPAHLDRYKTLNAVAKDIFSIAAYLDNKNIYVNGESAETLHYVKKSHTLFGSSGVADWKVNNIKVSITGSSFDVHGPGTVLKLKSKLLGRHLIGPLVLAAFLGRKYGLSNQQIEAGISKIEPFEHRMSPYQLSGAWIIDDTYNGNIEGMKAGLALLKELPAERKIYITPGLVDQGPDEQKIHETLGRYIKDANPDKVVLMSHSVTDAIVKGLQGYTGQLTIEEDPLEFYTNLDKFVAAGDLVLMQNDWPDNYN